MGTYYGYTNRDQDKSIIDWAGITKTISDDLIATDQSRKAERFELQKTQDEQLNNLYDFTQGTDKTANQAAMQAAQGYRDFLMENHKLMKNGLISVNDSKLVKSNSKATWATLNTAFKGHQDAYQAKIDAGGDGNLLLAEQMSKIFDFENKKIVPLPDGTAVFVKVDPKTGKIDMDTAQTPTAIMNMQMQEWPTIDVQKSASEVAKTAAIWKKAPNSTTTVENIRENPEFAAWKKNSTSAALDSDRRIASVLMDYLNYETTEDKDLASGDPRMVLMVKDKNGIPQPEFSEGQKGKAEEAYGSALEIALGYKETKVAPVRATTISQGNLKQQRNMNIIDNFVLKGEYSGLKAALGQVATNVTLGEDGSTLNVMLKDGNVKTLDLTQGPKSVGVEIAGILSPELAGVYNDKSKTNRRGSKLSDSLTDKTMYTPISTKGKLSSKEITKLSDDLLPPEGDYFGPASATTQKVESAVSAAARTLGLDPSKVTISGIQIMYNGVEIGEVNKTTGSQIASELESIKGTRVDLFGNSF